jgi:glucose-1-phosphate thymidylyltransferase
MKCLVLAAGYATRLYPLTKDFPKPLLQVRGKTILDWLLEDIDGSKQIDGYAVVTNHKFARVFHQWADGHHLKIDIVDDGTSTNESRLGAVCDIQYTIDRLSLRDDLLVIAGDNLLDFSLQSFISYSIEKGTSCTMRYLETDESKLRKCGVSEVDADDKLISLEEKPENPKSQWATPPFY